MAKESMKAKERKRAKLVAKHEEKRAILRKAQSEGDWEAMFNLQKLPKNSMGIRKHNRCLLTGRSHSTHKFLGLSRIKFRQLASNGLILGLSKSSW